MHALLDQVSAILARQPAPALSVSDLRDHLCADLPGLVPSTDDLVRVLERDPARFLVLRAEGGGRALDTLMAPRGTEPPGWTAPGPWVLSRRRDPSASPCRTQDLVRETLAHLARGARRSVGDGGGPVDRASPGMRAGGLASAPGSNGRLVPGPRGLRTPAKRARPPLSVPILGLEGRRGFPGRRDGPRPRSVAPLPGCPTPAASPREAPRTAARPGEEGEDASRGWPPMPCQAGRVASHCRVTVASSTRTRSPTPLVSTFSLAAAHASGSSSAATTREAPRRAAAMERMPEPAPTSSTTSPGWTRPSSRRRHPRVVPCSAVPKAMPGSIWITRSPGPASGSSQLGCTTSRGVILRTARPCFQYSAQSSWRCQDQPISKPVCPVCRSR